MRIASRFARLSFSSQAFKQKILTFAKCYIFIDFYQIYKKRTKFMNDSEQLIELFGSNIRIKFRNDR